jgi:tRNA-Thr(GGU) m(6)t(6)A37 methyltransferase TsaA
MTPIGTVHSARSALDDDGWDGIPSHIELAPTFGPEALAGLDQFSHVEVLFAFDRAEKTETGARHPRGNPAWPKVGIFAQRGKDRPNHLGITVCRLDRVEGTKIFLTGLDAVDGTPVLDVKPWMKEFGPRGEVHQPAWATELMSGYW